MICTSCIELTNVVAKPAPRVRACACLEASSHRFVWTFLAVRVHITGEVWLKRACLATNSLTYLETASAAILSPPARSPLCSFVCLLALRFPTRLRSSCQRGLLDLLRPFPPCKPSVAAVVLSHRYAFPLRRSTNLKVRFPVHICPLSHHGRGRNWRHAFVGRRR